MAGLAGRLAPLLVSPVAGAVGGGLLGSGLSVAGNMASEEGRKKPAARILSEAALAGGMGALVGRGVAKARQGVTAVRDSAVGKLMENAVLDPAEAVHYQNAASLVNNGLNRVMNVGLGTGGAIGITAAGGLGGLLGGGVANVLQVPQTHEPDIDGSVEQYLAGIQASDPMVVG